MTPPTLSPNVLSTSKERVNLNMTPETVSDCCGESVKTETYTRCTACKKLCTTKTTTKVKPRVEKWEDVARKIEAILTQKPVYVKPGLSKEAERQLTLVHQRDSLLELLASSVQEAKAERDEEIWQWILDNPTALDTKSVTAIRKLLSTDKEQYEEKM